jgi:hypothetical protein
MKRITFIGLTLVAVIAVAVTAASAFASEPEFKNSSGNEATGTSFKSLSGEGELKGTEKITCKGGVTTGKISGPSKVSEVLVDFTGCYKGTTSNQCKSTGQSALSILTLHLQGTLGNVAKAEATSEVGELLSPENGGTEYTAVEKCTTVSPTKVKGSVIGEVVPVEAPASKTGYLLYAVSSPETLQAIMSFVGFPEDKLTAVGSAAIKVNNTVEFESPVYVVK